MTTAEHSSGNGTTQKGATHQKATFNPDHLDKDSRRVFMELLKISPDENEAITLLKHSGKIERAAICFLLDNREIKSLEQLKELLEKVHLDEGGPRAVARAYASDIRDELYELIENLGLPSSPDLCCKLEVLYDFWEAGDYACFKKDEGDYRCVLFGDEYYTVINANEF